MCIQIKVLRIVRSYVGMLFEAQGSFLKVTTLNREKTNERRRKMQLQARVIPTFLSCNTHASRSELSWSEDGIPGCCCPPPFPCPCAGARSPAKSRVSRGAQTEGEPSFLLQSNQIGKGRTGLQALLLYLYQAPGGKESCLARKGGGEPRFVGN